MPGPVWGGIVHVAQGPVASTWLRIAARTLDAVLQIVVVVVVLIAAGDANRPFTNLFLAFLVVWGYEAAFTAGFAGTPAKRLVGLRVAQLDHKGRPTPAAAVRRGAAVGACSVVPVLGWILWAVSGIGDSLGRSFVDRVAHTMVTPERFTRPVATRDLPGYADGVRPPRLVDQGRVADFDTRVRARLRRLTASPLLAFAIGLLALGVAVPVTTVWVVLGTSVSWVILFVVDETLVVRRTGTTPGHQIAGLVIVDRRRGTPPRTGRAFARAIVLGTTVYVPLLWPVLAVSMLMMRYARSGRGLHDLAGGTVVVNDPALDPETQRQRSMRMRMGLAG